MSRPLFEGSYLQVMLYALSQWKGRKNASNDDDTYILLIHVSVGCALNKCGVRSHKDGSLGDMINLTIFGSTGNQGRAIHLVACSDSHLLQFVVILSSYELPLAW